MDEAKIAELKAAHPRGELTLITIGEDELVLKKPTRLQYNRFREGLVKGENVLAGQALVQDSLVYPTWAELTATGGLLEREPKREDELVGEVTKLAKSDAKLSAKKL